MPQASYTVVIGRPIDAVFAFVADGERCPEWRPGVVSIEHVSGEGVGARYRQRVQGPMGRAVPADYEVTVFEPNRRLEFQTGAGPARPHGRYDLETVDGGTRLTFTLDAQPGRLMRLFMGSMFQRTMDAEVHNLDNLKRVLEA